MKSERNKTQERQLMQNTFAHHPLTNVQPVLITSQKPDVKQTRSLQLCKVYGMTYHRAKIEPC